MNDIKLQMRASREIDTEKIKKILIRGTNWIGDVIMSLPAVSSVRKTFPNSHIVVLAKPWVADLYRACSEVDDVIVFESPGRHDGLRGKLRLAEELRDGKFDIAILLQNAIEAGIIAWLAHIPIRAGYNSDCRGFLLTHSVHRTREVRKIHQIYYYLEMVKTLGFNEAGEKIRIAPEKDARAAAERILKENGIHEGETIIGIAPGATYGPAKMWFPKRFAEVADRLADEFSAKIVLFGSPGDRERADLVQEHSSNRMINIAGATTLKNAIAVIKKCNLFISNDSGLMHLAGALEVPLVAIFGSTNPVTTSPPGKKSVVIHKDISCSPCLKKECPTDFRCMDLIYSDDVFSIARGLLQPQEVKPQRGDDRHGPKGRIS